jgi:D-alanyl-D-alanine carboxypeptidase
VKGNNLVKQIFGILLAILIITVITSPVLAGNPRHAVFVYDADNGRILHQENGGSQRYPASLTKMMTLYLLFEHMERGRTSLASPMNISALAAIQPQTNISVRKGGRITVEQAIKALVVRSANDVAVVVAEHVGGSVSNFATMATSKARALGMMNTRFKNPHGLPDNGQVTTARDMAILGAALRKHFPQYYHYFNTRRFVYQGRTYNSHNRVLTMMKGVDGLKTGFIRASGFNVVSSFKHDGFDIVAVVMGGNTAYERDNLMVRTLKNTHQKLLAERSTGRKAIYQVAKTPDAPTLSPVSSANSNRIAINQNNVKLQFNSQGSQSVNSVQVAYRPNKNQNIQNANYVTEKKINVAAAGTASRKYAVQVGVFNEPSSAKSALVKIASKVRGSLNGAVPYVEYAEQGRNILHRARLKNLTYSNASSVCQQLRRMSHDCFVIKVY